ESGFYFRIGSRPRSECYSCRMGRAVLLIVATLAGGCGPTNTPVLGLKNPDAMMYDSGGGSFYVIMTDDGETLLTCAGVTYDPFLRFTFPTRVAGDFAVGGPSGATVYWGLQ